MEDNDDNSSVAEDEDEREEGDTCSTISFRNEEMMMDFVLADEREERERERAGTAVTIDAYSSGDNDDEEMQDAEAEEDGVQDEEESWSDDKEDRYLAQMSDPRFMTARQRSLQHKRRSTGAGEVTGVEAGGDESAVLSGEPESEPVQAAGPETEAETAGTSTSVSTGASGNRRQRRRSGDHHRRLVKQRQQEEQRATVERLLRVTPVSHGGATGGTTAAATAGHGLTRVRSSRVTVLCPSPSRTRDQSVMIDNSAGANCLHGDNDNNKHTTSSSMATERFVRVMSSSRPGHTSYVSFSHEDLCPSWPRSAAHTQAQRQTCAAPRCSSPRRYLCAATAAPLCHKIACYRAHLLEHEARLIQKDNTAAGAV